MKDKKAEKLIMRRAKKQPELDSERGVYYAKMMRIQIKDEEQQSKSQSE